MSSKEPETFPLYSFFNKPFYLIPLLHAFVDRAKEEWDKEKLDQWKHVTGITLKVQVDVGSKMRLVPKGNDCFNILLHTGSRANVRFIRGRLLLMFITVFLRMREFGGHHPVTFLELEETPAQLFDFGTDRILNYARQVRPLLCEFGAGCHLHSSLALPQDLFDHLVDAALRDAPELRLSMSISFSSLNARRSSLGSPICIKRTKVPDPPPKAPPKPMNTLGKLLFARLTNKHVIKKMTESLAAPSPGPSNRPDPKTFGRDGFWLHFKNKLHFHTLEDKHIKDVKCTRDTDIELLSKFKECLETCDSGDRSKLAEQLKHADDLFNEIAEGEYPSLLPRWVFVYIHNAHEFLQNQSAL